MNAALVIQELTVAYQKKPVLWHVNAVIPQGIMMAVVGPNGAGKSTLLKTAIQLIKPMSGCIELFGQNHASALQRVAYVPQRLSIDWTFPITVLEVVLMGTYASLGWFVRPGHKERKRALDALQAVEMDTYADTSISQLSGGQQQRIFIARALVQQADLYLMDEPFVGIDAPTELLIVSIMQSLRDQGKTMIIVHHDLQSIDTHFEWIMLLNVQCIAYGQRDRVFTQENLAKTYGKHVAMRI